MTCSPSSNSFQTVAAALLKLKATFGRCAEENISVKTVCLLPPQQRLQPGVTCEIAGYGKEQHGEDRRVDTNSWPEVTQSLPVAGCRTACHVM